MTVLKAKTAQNLLRQPYHPVTKVQLTFEDHYNSVMEDYHRNQVAGGNIPSNLKGLEGLAEGFKGFGDDDPNDLNGISIDDECGMDRCSDSEVFDTTKFTSDTEFNNATTNFNDEENISKIATDSPIVTPTSNVRNVNKFSFVPLPPHRQLSWLCNPCL